MCGRGCGKRIGYIRVWPVQADRPGQRLLSRAYESTFRRCRGCGRTRFPSWMWSFN